jgi:hypothetical protein
MQTKFPKKVSKERPLAASASVEHFSEKGWNQAKKDVDLILGALFFGRSPPLGARLVAIDDKDPVNNKLEMLQEVEVVADQLHGQLDVTVRFVPTKHCKRITAANEAAAKEKAMEWLEEKFVQWSDKNPALSLNVQIESRKA